MYGGNIFFFFMTSSKEFDARQKPQFSASPVLKVMGLNLKENIKYINKFFISILLGF